MHGSLVNKTGRLTHWLPHSHVFANTVPIWLGHSLPFYVSVKPRNLCDLCGFLDLSSGRFKHKNYKTVTKKMYKEVSQDSRRSSLIGKLTRHWHQFLTLTPCLHVRSRNGTASPVTQKDTNRELDNEGNCARQAKMYLQPQTQEEQARGHCQSGLCSELR